MKPKMVCLLALVVLALCSQGAALANSGYLAAFKATYPTSASRLETCNLCHTSAPALNSFGNDFAANHPPGFTPNQAFIAIEPLDSDLDGYSNLEELAAGSMPGDRAERPDTLASTSTGTQTSDTGSISITDPTQGGDTIVNIFNYIYNTGLYPSTYTTGQEPTGGTTSPGGGTTTPPPANNAAVCANCHNDGRSGATPSGHQDISAYQPGPTTNPGGPTLTNNAAVCLTCHNDGRSGATPSGHPDISQLTQILFNASGGATPTSNAAICAQCHDGGRSGTIPDDHEDLTGNIGSGGDDDDEEDD